jgi:sulfite exporter TauE/SafE
MDVISLSDFIIGILFLILGYIIGRLLNFSVKIVFIVMIILFMLYILGILTKGMLSKLSENVVFLKDIYSKFSVGHVTLNFQLFMFAVGILIGLLLDGL